MPPILSAINIVILRKVVESNYKCCDSVKTFTFETFNSFFMKKVELKL